MISILLYISLISGGILVVLLLLSLISGLDLDFELADDFEDGGAGIIKASLTFFSVGAYIVRGFLMADSNPVLALFAGVLSGGIAVFILSIVLKWILRQQENVNWKLEDALYQTGKAYLKIPIDGSGIIQIEVNGVNREIKAKTNDQKEIPTGSKVQVEKIEGEFAIVTVNIE